MYNQMAHKFLLTNAQHSEVHIRKSCCFPSSTTAHTVARNIYSLTLESCLFVHLFVFKF